MYFNLARGWTIKDKGNSSLKVISFVYSLRPNDYSQPPDICFPVTTEASQLCIGGSLGIGTRGPEFKLSRQLVCSIKG